jgi:hypothetical protein
MPRSRKIPGGTDTVIVEQTALRRCLGVFSYAEVPDGSVSVQYSRLWCGRSHADGEKSAL